MYHHPAAMRRARAPVRTRIAGRLRDAGRRHPEWRAWLALLGELDARRGERAEVVRVEAGRGAPLLDGCLIRVDADAQAELLMRLSKLATGGAPRGAAARSLRDFPVSAELAWRLLEGAICEDHRSVDAAAQARGVEPAALATVVRLASVPLLAACAADLSDRVPAHWSHGDCPVCGSWALLAELRGVERTRVLRCGRCGAAWPAQWLRCAYCGESDHKRLGALATTDALESRKAETCSTCRGYLKSLATLTALDLTDLLLADLETVELDLVARERGYGRPREPGHHIACRVQPA